MFYTKNRIAEMKHIVRFIVKAFSFIATVLVLPAYMLVKIDEKTDWFSDISREAVVCFEILCQLIYIGIISGVVAWIYRLCFG